MQADKNRLIKRCESAAKVLADERAKYAEQRTEVIKERARFIERMGIGAGALVTVTVTFVSKSSGSLHPHWLVKSLLISSLWLIFFSVLYSLLFVRLAMDLNLRDAINNYQEALQELVCRETAENSASAESELGPLKDELPLVEANAAELRKIAARSEITASVLATAIILSGLTIFALALVAVNLNF